MSTGSRVIRAGDEGWEGVEPRRYKEQQGAFEGVVRHALVGARGTPDATGFELRYFEVAPGGYSSLEHHGHAHAVMVVRGRGAVRLGDRTEPLGLHDVVYVAPHEIHRFEASRGVSLGFVCIVDRDRDRPVPVADPGPGTQP